MRPAGKKAAVNIENISTRIGLASIDATKEEGEDSGAQLQRLKTRKAKQKDGAKLLETRIETLEGEVRTREAREKKKDGVRNFFDGAFGSRNKTRLEDAGIQIRETGVALSRAEAGTAQLKDLREEIYDGIIAREKATNGALEGVRDLAEQLAEPSNQIT